MLPSGRSAAEEVAGEAESEEPDDPGEVQCLAEAISAGGAPDHGESISSDGACGGLLSAEARVTEEPGGGKPHAGICAGGASASLPRLDRRQLEGIVANWTDLIGAVANSVTALAALGAGIAAFLGLRAWREQLASNTEHEIAHRLLRQIYNLRDRIGYVRRPIKTIPEMLAALKSTGRDPELDLKQGEIAAYEVRWKELQEAISSVYPDLLEAEALWGSVVTAKFQPLLDCVSELHLAIDNHVRNLSSDDRNAWPLSESDQKALYQARKDDTYNEKLVKAINEVENFLRPRLLTHGRRGGS